MKKILCVLVSTLIIFSIAACATQEDTPQVTTTEVAEVNPFEEFFEITWLVQYTYNYEEGRWDELELEDKFNVDLKVITTNYDDSEELTLMISAGIVPDIGFYPKDPIELYEQGLTRTISMSMIQKYFPFYYSIIEEYPIGREFNKVPDTEDEYYGITMASALSQFFFFHHCIRLDWLENIGYKIDDLTLFQPSEVFTDYGDFSESLYFTNQTFTYEEFLDINRAFTEDDPNLSGEDDTFFGIDLGFHMHSMALLCTFGLSGHFGNYLYKDDITRDVVPYYAYQGYRDYLIWRDFALNNGYIRRLPGEADWLLEKISVQSSGAIGYYEVSAQNVFADHQPENAMTREAPGPVLMANPNAKFVIFPGFIGPMGLGGNVRYSATPYRAGAWGTWKIGKEVSDDKLIRILHMFEYLNADEEVYIRYFYGKEGIHYRWAGEPRASAIFKVPEEELPAEYATRAPTNIFGQNKFLMNMNVWTLFSTYYYTWHIYQENNGWDRYVVEPLKVLDRMYFTRELYEQYEAVRDEHQDSVLSVRNDFVNRVNEGQVSNIELEWTFYLDALYNAGLEEMVKIFNDDDFGELLK